MRKITIERNYKDNDDYYVQDEVLHERLKQEIGFDYQVHPDKTPLVILEKNGVYYELRHGSSVSEDTYERIEAKENKFDKSDILCKCSNDSFYITYGSYECFGTCTTCGTIISLYSG